MSTLPSAGNETPKRVVTAQYLGRLREQGTFSPTKPKGTSNKDQTSAYLRKYCIPELLEDLTSDLAVNQPDDPRRHLHKRLGLMLGAEAAGEPPEDVSCFLRVHIECSTRHTDGAVAHFLRRSTLDAGTSSMVKGWMEEATGLLEGLVHEALGEPFVVGDGQFETQVEAESPGMSLEDAQIQIDDLKERLRMANATIDAMAQASRAEQEDSSPRGRKPASQVATMRAVPAITNSLQSMQFEPFLADTSWDNKKDPEGSCTFRIISVNDVYELENLPFLDGVIQVHGKENTVTMLPGDFVAPSLLSSLDKGKGMIDMLNRVGGTGIQYVCFGNHETDIPIDDLRQRIGEYKGKWINSNMPGWEEPKLPEYDIIEIESGGQKRKIGIIGVCTIDPNLYRAGAFGGAMATATPVCETAARLKKMLVEEHGCDLVIPMTHQVMAEDREMARLKMGFPVLIGGHDHDPYVEQVEGSWIVKTGCDATSAAIIDIVWPSASTPGEEPEVAVKLVTCKEYPENKQLSLIAKKHNHVVVEMESAFLCIVPEHLKPLSSVGMRRNQTTVGTLVCTFIKDGMDADCAILDAGCIRRNFSYPVDTEHFTYGDLKKEVPFDSEVCMVPMKGSVIAEAIKQSRSLAILSPPQDHGGYLQCDSGITWDQEKQEVTHIAGMPIDFDKEYNAVVLAVTLNGMNRNQPLIDWSLANSDKIPDEERHRPAKSVIVDFSSALIWSHLGEAAEKKSDGPDSVLSKNRLPSFKELDMDNSGIIDQDEIKVAVEKLLGGKSVPDFVVKNIMHTVDANNDGTIDVNEFNTFIMFYQQMNAFSSAMNDCKLRIIFVNDVYELGNFPKLDTLIRTHITANTITMLPGDFVAPSLLSSLDKGKGMIDCMNRVGGTGIQYVCFGNHETDIPIDDLRQRIGEYKGKWINSNMPGWEEPKLPEYDIIEIESGGQKRKIGIIGVCTIDPNLYRAGAFGGAMATATPVCETAARLKKMLVEEHGCDLVIPMTHQVMAEDREMARLKMGFPVLIGGHDHDPYVEQVEGSWIVKTGCDATSAAIIDIVWPSASTPGEEPEVSVELIPVSDYAASVEMEEIVHSHMRCVHEMEAAFLCALTPGIQLLSTGMRRGPTSVGTLISSLVRDGFRDSLGSVDACDGVMMDAGAIRRNYTYPENYDSFTYGDLKKEVPFDSEMVVVSIPGSVICDAIKASRERAYKEPPEDWGGYMQLDDGFKWDSDTNTVTHINHMPVEVEKLYSIGVLALSLNGMNRNQPLIDWANANPKSVPDEDAVRHAKDVVVYACSKKVWEQLGSFADLDADGDGTLNVSEVKVAMKKALRRDVSDLDAENLIKAIDTDGSGNVSADEFKKALESHVLNQ